MISQVMIVHGFIHERQIKKQRQKARALKKTGWWKQKLALGLCYYCKKKFAPEGLSMDHKVPLSRGGTNSKANVVVACKTCNSQKKHYTPVEMLLQECRHTERVHSKKTFIKKRIL